MEACQAIQALHNPCILFVNHLLYELYIVLIFEDHALIFVDFRRTIEEVYEKPFGKFGMHTQGENEKYDRHPREDLLRRTNFLEETGQERIPWVMS